MVMLTALFTEGKGAAFWGPYTIQNKIKLSIAKQLKQFLRGKEKAKYVFSTEDQAHLSRTMGGFKEHSLRSIRRGSLVHYARAGVSDANLQLLSGHRRRDTLLRYLGWGIESSDAREAAEDRANMEQTVSGGRVRGGGIEFLHPMWMGKNSGFKGKKGRRVCPANQLCAHRTHQRQRTWV